MSGKKRFYKKKSKASKSTKKRLKAVESKQKKNEPELKSFDTSWGSDFDSTGGILSLTQVGQGVTKYARIGNKIRLHQLHLQLYCTSNVSGNRNQTARVMIFRDKSPNYNSAPAMTDVLETANTWSILAKENVNTRFVVYYDRMLRLNYSAESDNTQAQINVKCPLHGLIQDYSTGDAFSAIKTNLYILLLGDVASFGIAYAGRTRLKFKDA